jgi:transcriptional regulator with XRE-family HTH domain
MERLGNFDAEGFFQAIDATRRARRVTWKDVASASGISASSLTRMAQGKRPDVDTLAALATWSGITTDQFIRPVQQRSRPEPLALISAQLRDDPHLSPDAQSTLDEMIKLTYERLRRPP